jgi:hypothetical protein
MRTGPALARVIEQHKLTELRCETGFDPYGNPGRFMLLFPFAQDTVSGRPTQYRCALKRQADELRQLEWRAAEEAEHWQFLQGGHFYWPKSGHFLLA